MVWITYGLLWCFYQLFGLSFWRHPFTAEHPLLRQWCNATFTFMHLADAFIQRDLHCIQVSFTFDQLLLSLGIEPMILALLAPCSTIWATGKPYISPNLMKKQTHPNLRWPEGEHISAILNFWVNYCFKRNNSPQKWKFFTYAENLNNSMQLSYGNICMKILWKTNSWLV